ncbi:YceI family protein [Flavihumibacter petaseus]|uniref:YceI family protein n=1 Tax=Flavihumibacter petaseus NBRC 106054 TaxID=1220578 RepID=A0A0E9MVW6_9BACT|nr:YceI family protein [Flavihumibacter petaseus]GAO41275.1 YceI family protein [Flavihumibacter petaseus NBRC 106054]
MATWSIDPNHSEITFKVKHLVISTVSGKFSSFEGTVEAEKEDFSDAKVQFSADIDSITTGNDQRDAHLKSPDFFDAGGHPKMTFVSESLTPKKDHEFLLKGNLTIRGTTHPVTLQAEFGGTQQDFYGNTVAGFEMTGKINRQDFGLTWSAVTEAGGIVVSDEVKLSINVELIKKA